MDHLKKEQN